MPISNSLSKPARPSAPQAISTETRRPPRTRYQGSKLKLLPWIWEHLAGLDFQTALDAFGGTGSVSYMLKDRHKQVTYNDCLRFNHWIGTALIENSHTRLDAADVEFLLRPDARQSYDDLIARTFDGIYFTSAENRWLDMLCQNIPRLPERYKRALAYYALFQACIAKRPYNLFHRKNLYMRTAEVSRSFGNKATWDTPFEVHFRRFVAEANRSVFDHGEACTALCHDAAEVPGRYDLVYIDPPYLSGKRVGVDYLDFYHFLEGMVDYPTWADRIDHRKKHLPLVGQPSPWCAPRRIHQAFRGLFERHADAVLVVSYRSDGIPSAAELLDMLKDTKRTVHCHCYGEYRYALSRNSASRELLFVAC